MTNSADVVVIGAGIAGVSAAYYLTRDESAKVIVVDPRPPLSLTSDKSTECYRNFWPSRDMVALTNRSIDLLEQLSEESDDYFALRQRGYLFVTADSDRLEALTRQAATSSELGMGPVRRHPGRQRYGPNSDGGDILTGKALRAAFPFLTDRAVGALHVRRAGWFSAQQLGALMLDRFKGAGGEVVVGEAAEILVSGGRVEGVGLSDGLVIGCGAVVVAAGPLTPRIAATAGLDLPLFSELHLKVSFRDHLGVIPRDAPMIIWSDPQRLGWSESERAELATQGRDDLLGEMPVFCHGRPEGGAESQYFVGLWEYHREVMEPVWPLPDDPLYPEVVMRGLATMVPGLSVYLDHLPKSTVDGGYYTKTIENRPLIGPAGPEGLYLMTGLSGFGVMVSAAAGDLVAGHIQGRPLPDYADDFLLSRYRDPAYSEAAREVDEGQL
jgi:glycine/D-amino acid oxidase-like deaminating enzyme